MKAKVNRSHQALKSIESPGYQEMLETTLKSSEKLQAILRKYFSISLESLPKLDPKIPPLNRKLIFMGHIFNLYTEHLLNLNARVCGFDRSMEEAERDKIILMIPELLAELKIVLIELNKETPRKLKQYGDGVFLLNSTSEVFITIFRLFNNSLTTTTTKPEHLLLLEKVIEFYEYCCKETFEIKFDETGKKNYLYRAHYLYTSGCTLYSTYLDVYIILNSLGDFAPAEEVFLKYAKKYKQKLREHRELVPSEKFVPRADTISEYFSFFDYYRALVNFYSEDPENYFHYLAKMFDAKEDFNIISMNSTFLEKINKRLENESNLKHRLLLLSLALQTLNNHLDYYPTLSEKARLRLDSSLEWQFQGTVGVEELQSINELVARERYYSDYVKTVGMLAENKVELFETFMQRTKFNLFLEKITLQVHSNPNYDIHDVYAELNLVIKDEQFAQILMEQLERINVPCYLKENTISIEASLLKIDKQSLKQAFLKAAQRCNNLQMKRRDQLIREEREKASLATSPEKVVSPETEEREGFQRAIPMPNEGQEQPVEEKEKEKKLKADKKSTKNEGEKELNSSKKGSFFNPRQVKATSLPSFKMIPLGAKIHKLLKSDNTGCKYWACIHPMLVQKMNREHKTLELNRLHRQLSEGSLGKGRGVRGIIEGNTIKWDDPSRDCRYYGLVAEEHSIRDRKTGKVVKHILLMFTTKVDAHTNKTPNILIPPELKEKTSDSRTIRF